MPWAAPRPSWTSAPWTTCSSASRTASTASPICCSRWSKVMGSAFAAPRRVRNELRHHPTFLRLPPGGGWSGRRPFAVVAGPPEQGRGADNYAQAPADGVLERRHGLQQLPAHRDRDELDPVSPDEGPGAVP